MNTLGQRIAYFRKQKGLTQEALAELCSVSAQAVSKWENDLTAPDISLLPRLAEIFSVTVDELLGAKKEAGRRRRSQARRFRQAHAAHPHPLK